jgi:cobalt/nickel transport system ATP-binding protein
MDTAIFELNNVYFSYLGRYPALRGVNMNINRGEKITVIGANGSGKSTLLHMLDGLIFPDRGAVKAFGRELNEKNLSDQTFSRNFRKMVGMVFQNPDVQLFCPTVKDDIVFGPLQLGVKKEEVEKRFEELAAMLDIRDLSDRSPHQLSVGEKRRVCLAAILAIEPEVLLLDEPTAGLDPKTTRHLIDALTEGGQSWHTIITATQDLHIVPEIADRVIVLGGDKRVARETTPAQLADDRQFLENHNLVHIHAHRHKETLHIHPHEHANHHTH